MILPSSLQYLGLNLYFSFLREVILEQSVVFKSLSEVSRGQLKRDGTRAETRFRLSAKRARPFKSAGGVSSVDYWQPRCADQR